MERSEISQLISETLKGLFDTDIIAAPIEVTDSTVLIGDGAELDSMAFVTFFADLEQAISDKVGRAVFLSLDKITDFDAEDPKVTTLDLISHIEEETSVSIA